MKGWPCPCPALPHFWQLGSCYMAEGSGPRAPPKGPLLNIQLLRAQYEGLRQKQRGQAHVVVLPKGGNLPTTAESMVSAVWINMERRHSLTPEEAAPEAEETLEEDDRGCLQTPESPWHTHLEMHRLVQTFHPGTSLHVKHKDKFTGSEQKLTGLFQDRQMTQQETTISEPAQPECQADKSQTKAVGSGFHVGTQGPPAIKRSHRAGKPVHYPFPHRKTPRISQAARNLGLYGPA